MKNIIFKFALICIILLLSGCTAAAEKNFIDMFSIPDFQEPSGKNIAYFDIIPLKKFVVYLLTFSNNNDCTGVSQISKTWILNKNRVPLKISSEKAFTFDITYEKDFSDTKYCDFTITFVPQSNQIYVAIFNVRQGVCHLGVSQLVNGQLKPITITKRKETVDQFSNNSPFCEPY